MQSGPTSGNEDGRSSRKQVLAGGSLEMKSPRRKNAFEISRIYAEGWKAAINLSTKEVSGISPEAIAELNPYSERLEKLRWREGFRAALRHSFKQT